MQTTMIGNGEIVRLYNGKLYWMATVIFRGRGFSKIADVQLEPNELSNGRLADGVKQSVVNRALTQFA